MLASSSTGNYIQICVHVKDPISICRKRAGGMETRKHYTHDFFLTAGQCRTVAAGFPPFSPTPALRPTHLPSFSFRSYMNWSSQTCFVHRVKLNSMQLLYWLLLVVKKNCSCFSSIQSKNIITSHRDQNKKIQAEDLGLEFPVEFRSNLLRI